MPLTRSSFGPCARAQKVEEHVEGAALATGSSLVRQKARMRSSCRFTSCWPWPSERAACRRCSALASSTASACSQLAHVADLARDARTGPQPISRLAGDRAVHGFEDRGAAGLSARRRSAQRAERLRRRPARSVFVSTRRSATAACLHGLLVRVEGRGAVDRVDHRDDAFERVAHRQVRVVEHRVQDRRRVGEAGGLDDDAAERRDAAVVAPAQEVFERRR